MTDIAVPTPVARDRRARRAAALAGGDAAAPDRGRAQPLHRGAGGRQEGGRHRRAEPLAPGPGARRHPGRDHPLQHHHDRPDRRRENRGGPPARPAQRRAVHQGRGLQVHRGGLRRPRRRIDGARPGGRRHQHGPDRARGRGLSPGRAAGRRAAAGSAAAAARPRRRRRGPEKTEKAEKARVFVVGSSGQAKAEKAATAEDERQQRSREKLRADADRRPARRPRGRDRGRAPELPDDGDDAAAPGDGRAPTSTSPRCCRRCCPSAPSAAR